MNQYRKLLHETLYRAGQMVLNVYKRWLDAEFQPEAQPKVQEHPVSEKDAA